MLTAAVLAIFWIPLFYVVVSSMFKDKSVKQSNDEEAVQ